MYIILIRTGLLIKFLDSNIIYCDSDDEQIYPNKSNTKDEGSNSNLNSNSSLENSNKNSSKVNSNSSKVNSDNNSNSQSKS